MDFVSQIDFIRPICLPLDEPLRSKSLIGETAMIAGWGASMFQGPQSSVLRHTQVKIVSTVKCARGYKPHFPAQVFDDRIICAGGNGHDTCQGDSGKGRKRQNKTQQPQLSFLVCIHRRPIDGVTSKLDSSLKAYRILNIILHIIGIREKR